MQRKRTHLFGLLLLVALALLASPSKARDKIGVVMLHGENPGSSQDPHFSKLKPAFEKAGMLVLLPDMP
jgi:poly(3-hydroxybutyrate) depolymerase